MSLALNKIILANATANTPGAYLQFVNLSVTTAGNVVPAGLYLFPPTANVTINMTSAVNAAGNITSVGPLLANNTGGTVFSDGVNVFANATAANVTVQVLTVDGGQNVSGTYNNV
jgi:hypothetical protein